MVDLAGSEKQKKTMIKSAAQKKEAIKINLSLTTLRKVIADLVNPKTRYISYRESNLTRYKKKYFLLNFWLLLKTIQNFIYFFLYKIKDY